MAVELTGQRDVSVIILAGGTGKRFGTIAAKLVTSVKGKPLISYPLDTALSLEFAGDIIVVCHASIKQQVGEIAHNLRAERRKPERDVVVCEGGDSRAKSVAQGLKQVRGRCVMIHDGDRPLATTLLYRRVLDALRPGLGVIPVISPTDSVIQEDQAGRPIGYLGRSEVLLAQTPQAFVTSEYGTAREILHTRVSRYSDDGSLFAAGGYNLVTVPGERNNIKVTYPIDIKVVEAYLEERRDE
jgi:2-C-methyl-D-erythritol 4-phosphate cytidylyltransferase